MIIAIMAVSGKLRCGRGCRRPHPGYSIIVGLRYFAPLPWGEGAGGEGGTGLHRQRRDEPSCVLEHKRRVDRVYATIAVHICLFRAD